MRRSLPTLSFVLYLGLALPGVAKSSPVAIQGSELHELKATSDAVYELYVALPEEYGDSLQTQFPVLYLTDASQFFGMVTQTYRMLRLSQEIPAMILVGVERRTPGTPWLVGRTIDLTPTESPKGVAGLEQMYGQDVPSGGADAFLSFLVDNVVPWVETRYRASEDRALAGYSLGGLFAAHALFHTTESFTDYIVGSPSLWWDDRMMFDQEEAYSTTNDDLPARVFLSIGGDETPGMIKDVERFAAALKGRGYASLELDTLVIDGETHMSGIPASFSRGLRFLFVPR